MKNYRSIVYVIGLVCVCVALTGGPTTVSARTQGHLIIHRVANFGEQLTLNVAIDGKNVAYVGDGQTYDGFVSPGQHVITVTVSPNLVQASPYNLKLNIKSNGTYVFTAIWRSQNVVLVK
jgi:hypothetical protein